MAFFHLTLIKTQTIFFELHTISILYFWSSSFHSQAYNCTKSLVASMPACNLTTQVSPPPKVVKGKLEDLQPHIRQYILEKVDVCQPDNIHICDGTEEENVSMLNQLEKDGMIKRLTKYSNW